MVVDGAALGSGRLRRGQTFQALHEYDVPASLDDLAGPLTGLVRLPPHIDTSPDPTYDLADEQRWWEYYSRVVRDGSAADHDRFLNRDRLVGLWPSLNLPDRCRQAWEGAFPQLRAAQATPRA